MIYGLLGKNIQSSFSPFIHNYLRPSDNYQLFDLKEEELSSFFKEKEFDNLNVTAPYKERIIPYLDKLDESAVISNCVNTIINHQDHLVGYNTDRAGFKELLLRNNIEIDNKHIYILGSGGSAKSIEALLKEKTNNVYIVSSSPNEKQLSYSDFYQKDNIEIIINTTPLGNMANTFKSPIKLERFINTPTIIDINYLPYRSDLLLQGEKLGLKTINGISMLVSQAIASQRIFLPKTLIADSYDNLYFLLNAKRNIILIGMPTAGKTTIGKLLAEKMNKSFIDTDLLIEEKQQKTIRELLQENSLSDFRKIEKEIIKDICLKFNTVISCGGGVIEDHENITLLKAMGRVYFIDRPLNLLEADPNRPLSSDKQRLSKLYQGRYNIYDSLCDIKIPNDSSEVEIIKKIQEDFYESCHR